MKNENEVNSRNELNGYPIQNMETNNDAETVSEAPVENKAPEVSSTFTANATTIGQEIESGTSPAQPSPSNINNNIGTSPEENEVFEDLIPKKGHKAKAAIIVAVVVLLVIGVIFGGAFFFVTSHTAEKYIDKQVKEIDTWVTKNLNVNKTQSSFDPLADDVLGNVKLSITSNDETLSILNDLNLDIKEEISLKQEIINMDFALKEGANSIIGGNVYLDKDNAYFDAPDLYPIPLKIQNEEDYIGQMKELYTKMQGDIITDVIKKLATNLKEIVNLTDISTEYSGVEAKYIYDINEKNIPKIKDKILSLLKEEESFNNFLTLIGEENFTIDIEPTKIIINQNIITNEISSVTFETKDSISTLTKVEDGKYRIGTDDSTYSEILYDENKIVLTDYINKEIDFQMSIEAKDDTINFSVKSDDMTINLEMIVKIDNANKKEDLTMNLNIDYMGSKTKITMEINAEYGANLITKKEITNAKSIDELTEEEQMTITNNLLGKLQSSKLFTGLAGMMENIGTGEGITNM